MQEAHATASQDFDNVGALSAGSESLVLPASSAEPGAAGGGGCYPMLAARRGDTSRWKNWAPCRPGTDAALFLNASRGVAPAPCWWAAEERADIAAGQVAGRALWMGRPRLNIKAALGVPPTA